MLTPRVSSVVKSSTSARRTPNPSLRTQLSSTSKVPLSSSFNQSFNRSLQSSRIIDENSHYTFESCDWPLPVQVTEAITLTERSADSSVKLANSGWAWLVVGRKLFIWKFKQEKGQRFLVNPRCHELILPPSDLAHKAELVCVFPVELNPATSAIAVSPEGTVRYWPNISQGSASIEVTVELHGQECYSLTCVQPLGCLLATTTGTLVLVTPTTDGRDTTVVCRSLRTTQGLLAGFGRRMSYFIFGSTTNQSPELHLVRVVDSPEDDFGNRALFVLGGSSLQKWILAESGSEKLLFDCDIDKMFIEKFAEPHQRTSMDADVTDELKIWLLDAQLKKWGLVVLAAAVNSQENRVHFACGLLDVSTSNVPLSFQQFNLLNYTEHYQALEDEMPFSYRLLLPESSSDVIFVYKDKLILCVSLLNNFEDDKIELRHPADKILGADSSDGQPLFFSLKNGIFSILASRQNDASLLQCNSVLDSPALATESLNLSVSPAILEEMATSPDMTSQLRAAFLLYFQQNFTKSQSIVDELLQICATFNPEVNSTLDKTAISLSQLIIDDYPASDPRWVEAVPKETAISTSLIIQQQLEDKLKAHELFIAFLKRVNIWPRLYKVKVRNSEVSTQILLLEHEEKLVAAKSLRNLQFQHSVLVDASIKKAIALRKLAPTSKLSVQDLFYREVSRVEDIFEAMIFHEDSLISTDSTPQTQISIVMTVNTLLLNIFQQVLRYRQSKINNWGIEKTLNCEGGLWTSTSGSNGIRMLLIKQFKITIQLASGSVPDLANRNNLYQEAVDLADLILEGYQIELNLIQQQASINQCVYDSSLRKYENERGQFIQPLMEAEQYERASILAEKYLDFAALLTICDITNNQERLEKYMQQFADKGFRQFAYKWYLNEGKRGQLLSQPALQQHDELRQFLEQHKNLSWIMDLRTKNFSQGHKTLLELGKSETDIMSRKKTYLSLSKLAALASDEDTETVNDQVEVINKDLDLILYQENLPAAVLENYGLDPDLMRVFTPVELIEMYIGEENTNANEYDFKKALDLLHFVPIKEEHDKLQTHIWCRSILKDRWNMNDIDIDNPVYSARELIFFKTVELVFQEGLSLTEILPNLNDLLQNEELQVLSENSTFEFVLKAGYEHIMKIIM